MTWSLSHTARSCPKFSSSSLPPQAGCVCAWLWRLQDSLLEPRLATFLHSVVLSHRTVEAAFSFLMANKLADKMMLGSVQVGVLSPQTCWGRLILPFPQVQGQKILHVHGPFPPHVQGCFPLHVQRGASGAAGAVPGMHAGVLLLSSLLSGDASHKQCSMCRRVITGSLADRAACSQHARWCGRYVHGRVDAGGPATGRSTDCAQTCPLSRRAQIMTIFREAYADDPSILEAGLADLQVGVSQDFRSHGKPLRKLRRSVGAHANNVQGCGPCGRIRSGLWAPGSSRV